MPLMAIMAIRIWTSLICAGSRVNSGSMKLGRGAFTTKLTQSAGMSMRGSVVVLPSTISLTCAITMPPEKAVASTMAGVSSVLGPV